MHNHAENNVRIGGVQIPANGEPRSLVRLVLLGTCSWRGTKPKEPRRHCDSQPWKGDTPCISCSITKRNEVLCKDKEQLLK